MDAATETPDLSSRVGRLELLREEHKLVSEAAKKANADLRQVEVQLANEEIAFARHVLGLLGKNGMDEMVSLTQRVWRNRVDAERAASK